MNLAILLLAVSALPFTSLEKILWATIEDESHKYLEREIESAKANELEDPGYYRLPTGITPESYTIRIIPFLEESNFTFKGEVSIRVSVKEPTDSITFHSSSLHITDGDIREDKGTPDARITIRSGTTDIYRDFIVLNLEESLKVGKAYTITMQFEGELKNEFFGLYRTSYKDRDGKVQWMALTQFQPTSARKAFPCFDEPHLKANFTLSIARSKEMNTLSNMDLNGAPESDPNLPASYVWDHYQESPKMSTYLVAITVSKFKYKKAVGKEFRVWARKDLIDQVDYSLKIGPKILDIFHELTNIQYEIPKMDMIAIPDLEMHAMENWGLVTYRESTLLYESGTSTPIDLQEITALVAHEMSHQWFGNLVTPEWWKYLWLNEGFATYFMFLAVELIEPTWRMADQFVVEILQNAFIMDSFDATHQLTFDMSSPFEILFAFDDITYNKGGSIVRMMEHFLTRSTFRQGLQLYLSRRHHDTTNDIQLFKAMNNQAKRDAVLPKNVHLKDIMYSWTNLAGYPVVTVERDYEEGRATIKQEKFSLEDMGNNENLRWWIPITFTTQGTLDFSNTFPTHWIPERDNSIVIDAKCNSDEWIIFNLQETGFYRVNYDEKNWKLITDYLNSKKFRKVHPVNRAQLVDDSLFLARGNYLNYHLALDLTSYLTRETDYIPWYSAYRAFQFLDTRLANSKEYPKFMRHILNLIENQYRMVKFEESSDDDHLRHLSRSKVLRWACKYRHVGCLSTASKLFSQWKESGINTVPVNLKDTVYCFAIAEGGEEEWNFLWNARKATTVATERKLIMSALGCSRNTSTLEGYLKKTISDDLSIRKQEYSEIFSAVYNNPDGLNIALDFLIANFGKIKEKYTIITIEPIIQKISKRISSKTLATKMTNFIEDYGRILEASKRAVSLTVQNIEINMDWIEKYVPVIETWLNEKYG